MVQEERGGNPTWTHRHSRCAGSPARAYNAMHSLSSVSVTTFCGATLSWMTRRSIRDVRTMLIASESMWMQPRNSTPRANEEAQ